MTAFSGPVRDARQAPVMTEESFSQQVVDQIRAVVGYPAQAVATMNQVRGLVLRHWLTLLTSSLVQQCQWVVQSGPFAGMNYVQQAVGAIYLPKVMGSYEAELHDMIQEIVRNKYRQIINIGCGEGYYAVGLARLLPGTPIHAFDTDPAAQTLCRQLASQNGVAMQVAIHGECRPGDLANLVQPGTLILCDIEGAEETLLDPAQVPGLAQCDILVETHDHLIRRNVTEVLLQRFRPTHAIQSIPMGGRDPNKVPVLVGRNQLEQWLAVWEGRPVPTPWLWMAVR